MGDERKVGGKGVRRRWRMKGGGGRGKGKSDLKRGHMRLLNECPRSHSSRAVHSVCGTLVHTRVHGGSALEHTSICTRAHINVRSIALVQECVCEDWASALEPLCVGSSLGLFLGSSIQECARSQSA
jgi:hypothetical protein